MQRLRRYSQFNWPSAIESIAQAGSANSNARRPLRYRKILSIVFNQSCTATVERLVFATRPLAISPAILAVIVDPFQRHSLRSKAHIRDERSERRTPFVANCDSAPAVMWKSLNIWIGASLYHSLPQSKHGVSGFAMACTSATARFCRSISEIAGRDITNDATMAAANPFRLLLRPVRRARKDGPFPNALARQVNKFWHVFTIRQNGGIVNGRIP